MKKNNRLVFKLEKKQLPDYEECHNYLGFKKIEIIEFNYDGEGNALVFENGDLSYYSPDTLRFIFFGGWYTVIKKDCIKKTNQ
jgi:hypothetical protein